MKYFKRQFALTWIILILVTSALGSLVMAEGVSNETPPSVEAAADNSCTTYSSNRDYIIANHSNIVDNGNGTATATFQTTQDCVRVSFSSYSFPSDWVPNGPGGTPYEVQIFFDGQSIGYDVPGTYSVTINIPACEPFQADIYSGEEQRTLGVGGHGEYIKAWLIKQKSSCDPTPTPSDSPTPTPEPTPTPTPSDSPTPTPEPTPTPTPSDSPTPTPDPTPTPTPSDSPTPTPDPTPTSTPSDSPTPTPDPTPTPTPSDSPTSTPDPTPTPTPSDSPTSTPDPTPTSTPSDSPTSTPDPTPTSTPSDAPTSTPASTPSSTTDITPAPSPDDVIIELDEEPLPADGIIDHVDDKNPEQTTIEITEETVPLDTLPKTGEFSSIPYYLIGAFFIMVGLLSLRNRQKSNKQS